MTLTTANPKRLANSSRLARPVNWLMAAVLMLSLVTARAETPWQSRYSLPPRLEKMNAVLLGLPPVSGSNPKLAEGDRVPLFGLWNQDGEAVSLLNFRGKKVVLNFIFTRCKNAKMCPAATAKMGQLDRRAQADGIDGYHLVTITFDPAYDAPPVLHEYGTMRGLDFRRHSLLTGDEAVIRKLLELFAVRTRREDGTIVHTATTVLIDADGKIAYIRYGPDWTVTEFLDRFTPTGETNKGE